MGGAYKDLTVVFYHYTGTFWQWAVVVSVEYRRFETVSQGVIL